jgi:hypothetical protein
MTQAARKVARGSHSLLALLLCVIVLAAAVDSDGTPNDTLLRDCTLAWADGDGDDDPDGPHSRTAYAYTALCGRLFTLLFPSHADFGISLPGCRSESRPACVQPRAPPCSRELSEATSHLRLIVSGARSSDLLVSPRVFRLRACRPADHLSREGGEIS